MARRNNGGGYARNRGCRTKQSYPTKHAAQSALNILIAKGAAGWRLTVYGKDGRSSTSPCQYCKGWHVGHLIERKL